MNLIQIVLSVKNETENLRRCITLAAKLGPVLIVDSSSTDETQKVAREFEAEVLQFEWNDQFPKKHKRTLRN